MSLCLFLITNISKKYIVVQHSRLLFLSLFHWIDGAKGQVGLHGLVQFWTGYPALPVDETTIMRVKFLVNNATKVLAESTTCNGTLQIPVVHEQYNTFKEYINKSVQFGKIGFRKVWTLGSYSCGFFKEKHKCNM